MHAQSSQRHSPMNWHRSYIQARERTSALPSPCPSFPGPEGRWRRRMAFNSSNCSGLASNATTLCRWLALANETCLAPAPPVDIEEALAHALEEAARESRETWAGTSYNGGLVVALLLCVLLLSIIPSSVRKQRPVQMAGVGHIVLVLLGGIVGNVAIMFDGLDGLFLYGSLPPARGHIGPTRAPALSPTRPNPSLPPPHPTHPPTFPSLRACALTQDPLLFAAQRVEPGAAGGSSSCTSS